MAKRKRLTPARAPADGATDGRAPETKMQFPTYPDGVFKTRPPIADVAHDAAASAALTEVAQTLTDARNEGRLIQRLPLTAIVPDYLVRDRIAVDAEEMATLIDSLRARGQQTAIEVTDLGGGQYGLISGWRRYSALLEIAKLDTGVDTVLAIMRKPADSADAYLAMVEENEIRVGLSFYERARIVVRAVDRDVYRADRIALGALFHAASRAKRSKIGAFIKIVRALDEHLRYPTAITERVGLMVAQKIDSDPAFAKGLITALNATPVTDASDEIARIVRYTDAPETKVPDARPTPPPAPQIRPDPVIMCDGLVMVDGPKGQITLKGDMMVNEIFRARLMAFLQSEIPVK